MSAHEFGDRVAWSVLAATVAVELGIWLAAWYWSRRDPYRSRVAEMRAELEIRKQDKARGKRVQERGF